MVARFMYWRSSRIMPSIGCVPGVALALHFINTTTFAARDFGPRRGASDAHTLQRSVRSEQRPLGQKQPPPGAWRRFSVLASLLLGHSPASGDAPSSRLARTENRRNKRGRIYETECLVALAGAAGLCAFMDFCPRASGAEIKAAAYFRKDIQPILTDYCYDCHGEGMDKGNVAFDELKCDEELLGKRDLWWAVF